MLITKTKVQLTLLMTSVLYQDGLISGKYVNIDIVLNQDPNRSAHEVVFSRKHTKVDHPDIHFKNAKAEIPIEKLNIKYHIEKLICKVQKVISIIKKMRHFLPRKSLITNLLYHL